jgi:hypothetical protein
VHQLSIGDDDDDDDDDDERWSRGTRITSWI